MATTAAAAAVVAAVVVILSNFHIFMCKLHSPKANYIVSMCKETETKHTQTTVKAR
jgi:hypothetical protein